MTTSLSKTKGLLLVSVLTISALLLPVTAIYASTHNKDDHKQGSPVIVERTCKDIDGFDTNIEKNSSGKWGSIKFTADKGPLVLNVNAGYEVTLCVKKGSSNNEMGPVVLSPFEGPLEGVEVNYPGSKPAEGFSHYALKYQKVYKFQFDKEWTGDTEGIDFKNDVTVKFTADGGFEWVLGAAPVNVVPGETKLTNVKEVVAGLPKNCDYTATGLPGEIVAPAAKDFGKDRLFTLTVTNDVTCEEDEKEEPPVVVEENGQVLADVTPVSETQQVVAPLGAVDAGAGNASVAVSSLAGLAGSLTAVSYGAVRFFKGE